MAAVAQALRHHRRTLCFDVRYHGLSSFGFQLFRVAARSPFTVPGNGLGVRRIRSAQRTTTGDLLHHELLEDLLFRRVARDLGGEVRGNDDHALCVAHDHVAREHRDASARDRNVEIHRVMDRQVQRRAGARGIHRKRHGRDRVAVAQAAVGDHAGGAAHFESLEQDAAGRRGAGVLPAIHHQHAARRNHLDPLALRMLGILEYADMVEVLARRNVAQRERLADHVGAGLAHAAHALEKDVAKAALEKLRGERRGAGAPELLEGFAGKRHGIIRRVTGASRAPS